jgi:hypothetical protein
VNCERMASASIHSVTAQIAICVKQIAIVSFSQRNPSNATYDINDTTAFQQ